MGSTTKVIFSPMYYYKPVNSLYYFLLGVVPGLEQMTS